MNVEKNYQGKGGYVFVSHSHLDIERVREIRNYLENAGMEPILFYLRCMDGGDDEKLASLKKLIFDEIDSREFFLYVDSENAAASEWVQEELAYIRAAHPDRIVSVDIADGKASTEQTLSQMVRGMRVFISASARDRELTRRLTDALVARDFRVYDVENGLLSGDAWGTRITHTITDLAKEGFVIALISQNSYRSRHFVQELKTAIENKVRILPIIVGQGNALLLDFYDLGREIPQLLHLNTLSVSENPTEEELADVVSAALRIKETFGEYKPQYTAHKFLLD